MRTKTDKAAMGSPIESLEELLELMVEENERVLDVHGQWRSDLPTFGGEEPGRTIDGASLSVWSWDEKRILCGTGDDLSIEVRT